MRKGTKSLLGALLIGVGFAASNLYYYGVGREDMKHDVANYLRGISVNYDRAAMRQHEIASEGHPNSIYRKIARANEVRAEFSRDLAEDINSGVVEDSLRVWGLEK
ncbi:MAG: hypothetical protein CMH64_00625 [Nanoarchaeota archaeon]|nr:hypothetical protein [Nanoarchaeota archaeon]|tara:strand:- start:2205 stop:2522 length:318 start_codon:yes stop_codon:yes gene_type:complete